MTTIGGAITLGGHVMMCCLRSSCHSSRSSWSATRPTTISSRGNTPMVSAEVGFLLDVAHSSFSDVT